MRSKAKIQFNIWDGEKWLIFELKQKFATREDAEKTYNKLTGIRQHIENYCTGVGITYSLDD